MALVKVSPPRFIIPTTEWPIGRGVRVAGNIPRLGREIDQIEAKLCGLQNPGKPRGVVPKSGSGRGKIGGKNVAVLLPPRGVCKKGPQPALGNLAREKKSDLDPSM